MYVHNNKYYGVDRLKFPIGVPLRCTGYMRVRGAGASLGRDMESYALRAATLPSHLVSVSNPGYTKTIFEYMYSPTYGDATTEKNDKEKKRKEKKRKEKKRKEK
jgi:hypothetical protein